MTKKDFYLIAKTILSLNLENRLTEEGQREYIAKEFAANLKQTNPRFDHERFVRACLPTQTERA